MARKPQMHQSAIQTLLQCGEKFRRRYIAKEPVPPNKYLLIGTALDTAVNDALMHKMTEGYDQTPGRVVDTATKMIGMQIIERGVLKIGEDEGKTDAEIQDEMETRTALLARTWAQDLGPVLRPKQVQKPYVIKLKEQPFDLAGTIDELEADCFSDLKTKRRQPKKTEADTSFQIGMYGYYLRLAKNPAWQKGKLHFIVADDAATKASVATVESEISEDRLRAVERTVLRAAEAIQKRVFLPARPDDYLCAEKWCEFWATCPFVEGKRGNDGGE